MQVNVTYFCRSCDLLQKMCLSAMNMTRNMSCVSCLGQGMDITIMYVEIILINTS